MLAANVIVDPWAFAEAKAEAKVCCDEGPDWRARHGIVSNGLFGEMLCQLCQKQLTDFWRVQQHLASKGHQSRMRNNAYFEDPLGHVPDEQRKFFEVLDGRAWCRLCHKFFCHAHLESKTHLDSLQNTALPHSAVLWLGAAPPPPPRKTLAPIDEPTPPAAKWQSQPRPPVTSSPPPPPMPPPSEATRQLAATAPRPPASPMSRQPAAAPPADMVRPCQFTDVRLKHAEAVAAPVRAAPPVPPGRPSTARQHQTPPQRPPRPPATAIASAAVVEEGAGAVAGAEVPAEAAMPRGWARYFNHRGRAYHVEAGGGHVQWERPVRDFSPPRVWV